MLPFANVPILGVPAVNIGTREAGRERGSNVVDAGYSREEIKRPLKLCWEEGTPQGEAIYGDGNAGQNIAEVLAEFHCVFQSDSLIRIMMKEKILALIPARGGSKGVPRKNIRNSWR